MGGAYVREEICLYFSKTLFEGLIFGGAYVWREISISKSIRLACSGKEIYHFCFVLLCIRGQIPSTSPPEGLYSEGRFNGGSSALRFWGLIFGGAYFWNFTVPSEFMTKSIKLNLYGEFNLTIIDPCKLLREIENKPGQFLSCFTSRM